MAGPFEVLAKIGAVKAGLGISLMSWSGLWLQAAAGLQWIPAYVLAATFLLGLALPGWERVRRGRIISGGRRPAEGNAITGGSHGYE